MKVTQKEASVIAKKLGVILSSRSSSSSVANSRSSLTLKMWTFAINVELEHAALLVELGVKDGSSQAIFAAKIAIAHLHEFPDYYSRLKEMEKSAEKYWKNKIQPRIFK